MIAKKRHRQLAASSPLAASPAKSVAEELRGLRRSFDDAVASYKARLHRELDEVIAAVSRLEFGADGALNSQHGEEQTRDLRDMLSLLRNLQLRPEKGRRKDLKKIDTTVGDLHLLIERWLTSRS